jgi:hypothetical protein
MPLEPKKNSDMESRPLGSFYAAPPKRRLRGRHLLVVLLIAAAGFGIYQGLRGPKSYRPWLQCLLGKKFAVLSHNPPGEQPVVSCPVVADPIIIRHVTLHCSDSLDAIFNRLKITGPNQGLRKAFLAAPFGLMADNDELVGFFRRADGRPTKLFYLRSAGGAYALLKNSSGWRWGTSADGIVVNCAWSKKFYNSCISCGLPEKLIPKLAGIFSYNVDVACDLKSGDSFSVFYQKFLVQSSRQNLYLLLGAQMNTAGKTYLAVGFDADGSWDYFDPKGESVERQFLKIPLDPGTFLNENSGSILKVSRPRFELMYIVPAGARVCAIGDGVVASVHRSSDRRFSIEIRHRGGYASWYGNLSACSRGLRRGTSVRRAMLLGSAASDQSGKAYFEFQFFKNGKPINFDTSEFLPVRSIPQKVAGDFAKTSEAAASALSGKNGADTSKLPSGKK